MENPLRALLNLPEAERVERGLLFTPQEIAQQPESWKITYQRCLHQSQALQALLARAGVKAGAASRTVFLVGAGTSDYACRALAPLLRERWNCDAWPVPSTTLLTDFDQYHRPGREYFWISVSRSGDSPEGVALLERALAQRPEIHHLVITCNARGQMAQLCGRHPERAFALLLDDAVNDRGLAMTSSFTNMVVAGQCVANLENLSAFGEVVGQMVDAGSQFLPLAAETAATVTTLGCPRACFIGSDVLRAVADESALKVVELTAGRVATVAESALGLRHGPLSSVDGQALLVAYVSSDPRRRNYERDLLNEICRKRLGRARVVVTSGQTDDVAALADYTLHLSCPHGFADEYRVALDVMLGQLLGLFASLRSGLKPDQPSPNGAITRVVSPIQTYS
ncbi:MAG: tagatose-6-phosphate ketose isomerase [Candidatus Sulfotelmatobacter sp.]